MANEQGVILEDVSRQMALDLQVYDLDGTNEHARLHGQWRGDRQDQAL
jgi:hypothetical protein